MSTQQRDGERLPPADYFLRHREQRWPAWKFGVDMDELFTTLPQQFNQICYPLLDRDAFFQDISYHPSAILLLIGNNSSACCTNEGRCARQNYVDCGWSPSATSAGTQISSATQSGPTRCTSTTTTRPMPWFDSLPLSSLFDKEKHCRVLNPRAQLPVTSYQPRGVSSTDSRPTSACGPGDLSWRIALNMWKAELLESLPRFLRGT